MTRRRMYSDLSAEIQEHLDEKIEELVASGMTRDEATAAARREFGNATLMEENGRETWQWRTVESTFRDVKYALRQLLPSPDYPPIIPPPLPLPIPLNPPTS